MYKMYKITQYTQNAFDDVYYSVLVSSPTVQEEIVCGPYTSE